MAGGQTTAGRPVKAGGAPGSEGDAHDTDNHIGMLPKRRSVYCVLRTVQGTTGRTRRIGSAHGRHSGPAEQDPFCVLVHARRRPARDGRRVVVERRVECGQAREARERG